MNNDIFLTRVWNVEEKRMLYSETSYSRLADNGIYFNDGSFAEFDEGFIPMNCVGLPDINGARIFDSDILKLSDGKICAVKYIPEKGAFRLIIGVLDFALQWPLNLVEVIGNIHMNPKHKKLMDEYVNIVRGIYED